MFCIYVIGVVLSFPSAGLTVKVAVMNEGTKFKKKRTGTTKVSISPLWNEAVLFIVPNLLIKDLSLVVDVCKDRLSSTEVMHSGIVHFWHVIGAGHCFPM